MKTPISSIKLSLLSLLVTLLALESYFTLFYKKTDFFAVSASTALWLEEYWGPLNSLGYRDREHTILPSDARKVGYIVGDSFVAGQGIEDVSDRFSNIIQRRLGSDWDIFNISYRAWNTKRELEAIKKESALRRPDSIVISYYVNDIEGSLDEADVANPAHLHSPTGWVGELSRVSNLFNFIYWRVFQLRHPTLGSEYWRYLRAAYDSKPIWEDHAQDLSEFITVAEGLKSRLCVVVFPDLVALEDSKPIVNKVVSYLRAQHIVTIDLTPMVSSIPLNERIVNSRDAHPSVETNRVVADEILKGCFNAPSSSSFH